MRLKATLNATCVSHKWITHQKALCPKPKRFSLVVTEGPGLPSRPREAPCWGAPATRGAGPLLLPISSWVPTVAANDEAWMLESSRTSAPTVRIPGGEQRGGVPVPLSVCTGNGCPLALCSPLTPRSLSPVPGRGL